MTKTITSQVSPIRVGDSSGERRTIYTALQVTETENSEGVPIYTSKIIRYLNQRLESPLSIAEGTTENPGVFTPTQFATVEEKKLLQGGGILLKTLKQQVNTIKKRFGRSPISAQQKEELAKIASGAASQLIAAAGDPQGGRKNPLSFSTNSLSTLAGRGSEAPSIPVGGNSSGSGGGSGGGARTSYPTLRYPETLNVNQDKLRISILKFEGRKFAGGKLAFADRSAWKPRSIGSVTLPVPTAVSDSNSASWGEDKMNAGQMMASEIAMQAITGGVGTGIDAAEKALDAGTMQGKDEVKDALKQYFVGQATGVKGILARTEGKIINPNMELIFNSPQLRDFSFTWKMSPRSEAESIVIKKIIRMFKQSMAPKKTEAELFLRAPNTYKLQFIHAATRKEHDFLPLIKECAMTGFNVNYTPDGNYATYRNSAMVAVELSFTFKELEPIFNNDYENDGDSSIGY
tara:strand:- start:6702 stop:8084 length:1383 start_codon:yes stop_codon:yes gene_type:complete